MSLEVEVLLLAFVAELKPLEPGEVRLSRGSLSLTLEQEESMVSEQIILKFSLVLICRDFNFLSVCIKFSDSKLK